MGETRRAAAVRHLGRKWGDGFPPMSWPAQAGHDMGGCISSRIYFRSSPPGPAGRDFGGKMEAPSAPTVMAALVAAIYRGTELA